jgi:hypothetical protein
MPGAPRLASETWEMTPKQKPPNHRRLLSDRIELPYCMTTPCVWLFFFCSFARRVFMAFSRH